MKEFDSFSNSDTELEFSLELEDTDPLEETLKAEPSATPIVEDFGLLRLSDSSDKIKAVKAAPPTTEPEVKSPFAKSSTAQSAAPKIPAPQITAQRDAFGKPVTQPAGNAPVQQTDAAAKQPVPNVEKGPAPAAAEPEAKILSQQVVEGEDSPFRSLLIMLVFGLIGAFIFAGVSSFYFSLGRRAGMLAVAFFAAVGARMSTDELRGNRIRWHAAFLAAGSAVAGKAMLVGLLFWMYPDFTAEDWHNFADPGGSSAIYFEESINNALSTDSSDKRSGQEKLDERFSQEFAGGDEVEAEADAEDAAEAALAEEDEEASDEQLSFKEVFPRVFDVFDFGLIFAAMIMAFRFARHGD